MIKLINGNCLNELPALPDGSVGLVLCDLPYGVTRNKWDSVIPLDKLWEQWHRIARPDAAVILFGQGMFTARLMMSNPSEWRYNLIWKKGGRVSGFLNANKMPMRNHEDIAVFYRRLPVYHPQMEEGLPLHGRGKSPKRWKNNNYGSITDDLYNAREGMTEKYPTSVLEFERPHPPLHPTQKPVRLLEWLVRTYSNPGDVVLDCTMGVGSTGVACVNTGREFVGIELQKEYFNIAQKRMNEAELERASQLFPIV